MAISKAERKKITYDLNGSVNVINEYMKTVTKAIGEEKFVIALCDIKVAQSQFDEAIENIIMLNNNPKMR